MSKLRVILDILFLFSGIVVTSFIVIVLIKLLYIIVGMIFPTIPTLVKVVIVFSFIFGVFYTENKLDEHN